MRSVKHLRLVIVAILCSAVFAFAQRATTISITVADPQQRPVPSASVLVYSNAMSPVVNHATTDTQGAVTLEVPAGGTFFIEVEAAGFRKTSRSVAVRNGESVPEHFPLEVAGVSASVVVTASDAPQTIDQTTKALTVVGTQEILDRDEYKVTGVLNTVPGVQIRSLGGPGQIEQVRVRGLRPDATAILIDGIRFRDPTTTQGDASSFLSNLNFISTDRIEVLRGSGSSLYGTNAAGGVVNVVSDPGGGATHSTLQAEGGSLGFLRGRTQVAGGALNNRFRYSAGAVHLNVMNGVDGNDRARSSGAQAFLRYDPTPRTSVSARLLGSDDFVQLNVSPTASGIPAANIPATVVVAAIPFMTYFPGRDDPDSRRGSRFSSTALKFQRVISSAVTAQASYQRVHTNRVYTNGPAGAGFQPSATSYSKYVGNIDTFDARSTIRVASWNQFTAGYEFERESYADLLDNNLPGTQRVRTQTSIRQNSNAAYFQDQSNFFRNKLQVSLSGRVQSFQLNRAMLPVPPKALTGDASISYFVEGARTKLRAHVGNAYRAPALYERFGGGFSSIPATGQLVFTRWGDPTLSPDRYNSADAGIDQYLWRDRVRVSATSFYSRVVTITAFDSGSVIKPATDPFGRSAGYINGSGGISRGLELGVEMRPAGSLTINGSYTYTRANMDRDITVPGFWRVLGVPRHTATLMGSRQIGKRTTVALDLTVNSEMFGNFFAAGRARAFQYPKFIKTDINIAYALKRTDRATVKLNTRVNNLFDRTYYDLGWLAPGASFVTGLTWMF